MSARLRNALLAVIAVALLAPATASALDRTVTVRGEATGEVPNDTADLGFSVSKERQTRAAALRIASIRLREVIAAAQATPGVGPGDITTGAVTVRQIFKGKEKKVFRASGNAQVVLHQPELAGDLISAAVAAGATGTRGPRFFAGDPETAYTNVLLAAFDQARNKAQALATRSGSVLGPAITIEEGTDVVPSQPAGAIKKGGAEDAPNPTPPTKPGTSTVTASVRVVFGLQ